MPSTPPVPTPSHGTPTPLPGWTATARYLALTTTRRDGRQVATAVWFAVAGSELLVYTGADSGKAKRIAHTPAVTVAPCDSRGRPLGDASAFTAELRKDLLGTTEAAIRKRYGLQARAFALVTGILRVIRRTDLERTAIVLRPSDKPAVTLLQ